ncbi:MAG: SDR family oxidoreductase [Bdellovibrionales bacterium]|nr:SDR family oxidoreductase [Oligoflexia bacterium]
MKKSILLTGAAGFVGSHLAEKLLSEGHVVVGVDNCCTGRMKNLQSFKNNPDFDFIQADASVPLANIIRTKQKWDWIMHLASPASPPKYFALPIETMLINSEGTRHLLELARENNSKFFYSSTSEVYGDPLEHPQTESYWGNVNSIGVRSIYDEAKRYGEALIYAYHRTHQVDARVIRIFNTYGPKMDPEDGRVVTNLMFQALRNEPMTIYGTGKQTRSFQYVADLVDGIVKLMKTNYVWPVNLGNPSEFTILEFAEKVRELIPTRSQLQFKDLPSDDPKQRKPDITLAKKIMGWEPKIDLAEGLSRTLEYFKTHEL